MATLDITGGTQVTDGGPRVRTITVERTLTAAESTALTSVGVIQLFDMKAGLLLLGGTFEVVTAGTADCNASIGLTGGDVDGFMAAADMDSTGVSELTGALFTPNYYVSAADTMDLLFDTAEPGALSFKLKVVCIDLG